MSNKTGLFFIITIVMLASCGTQKRLLQSAQKAREIKENMLKSSVKLDSLQKQVSLQKNDSVKDSVLSGTINSIIVKLQRDLDKMGESVSAVELLTQKRSNFNEHNFYNSTVKLINRLDSFQAAGKSRDRIYQLLNEAVKAEAFHEFDMGTFFELGAYEIPLTAVNKINGPFKPAIDSMIQLSNSYSDVAHKIYMIFVGYADATPINTDSDLYNKLKRFLPPGSEPDKEVLNRTLSQLRANELQRNMKLIIAKTAHQFSNYNSLNIGYVNYGRGEELPFKNITDYRTDDERRRVVVFYWSVLPVVE